MKNRFIINLRLYIIVLPEESSYVYMHVMMQKIREEDIALNDSDLDRILESEDFCGPTPLDETIQN